MARKEHPAPAGGNLPGFISHVLNEHVGKDGCENSHHDTELIESYTAAADRVGAISAM